jgi:DNA polymerase II small subunit
MSVELTLPDGTLFVRHVVVGFVPGESERRVLTNLLERGFNVDRQAVTLLAGYDDPEAAIDRVLETLPADVHKLSGKIVKEHLSNGISADSTIEENTTDRQRRPHYFGWKPGHLLPPPWGPSSNGNKGVGRTDDPRHRWRHHG